jgi:hypothetical protein
MVRKLFYGCLIFYSLLSQENEHEEYQENIR